MPILSLVAHLTTKSPLSFKRRGVGGEAENYIWIGGDMSMEQEKANEAGIRFIPITTYKLTSTKSLGVLLYPFKLLQ